MGGCARECPQSFDAIGVPEAEKKMLSRSDRNLIAR